MAAQAPLVKAKPRGQERQASGPAWLQERQEEWQGVQPPWALKNLLEGQLLTRQAPEAMAYPGLQVRHWLADDPVHEEQFAEQGWHAGPSRYCPEGQLSSTQEPVCNANPAGQERHWLERPPEQVEHVW